MAERGDAELAQIVRRQASQHRAIYVIGLERLGILAQPQAIQPTPNVHRLPQNATV